MTIALIATVVLVEPAPKPAHKTGLSAPLCALKHRGLLTMSLTALRYNWAFFTVLGYAPFPMRLSPIKLGLVFTGWGVLSITVRVSRLVLGRLRCVGITPAGDVTVSDVDPAGGRASAVIPDLAMLTGAPARRCGRGSSRRR
jgi:hypothetical protein